MNEGPTGGAETVILSALLSAGALALLIRHLARSRPELRIGRQIGVAFAIRLIAIAAVASTGLQSALRGGDEKTFLAFAGFLSKSPFGAGYMPHKDYPLHTVTFAVQIRFGDFSEVAMRITQVGIAMLGITFLVVAVHDLAGGRAAAIVAWVLAFEPASIFFNSALHKEPMMVLASGLMVYGGTKMWRRLDYSGIVLMALGGWLAAETRPYAGWFLITGGVLVILHASLRRMDAPLKAMPILYAVVIAVFIAAPSVIEVTSDQSLTTLQQSQDANTDPNALATGDSNSNNLALEQVDYSTRGAVLANLPERMVDVITRPYPWQVANASQQLGAIGSLFAISGLVMLLAAVWKRRGNVLSDVGPIFYPLLFLLMAYSLSAGNAGTSFRYRTHLVTLGIAMLIVLRERHREALAPALEALGAPVEHRAGKPALRERTNWPSPASPGK